MRVLIITQKLDEEDCLLGFFCAWIEKMAKKSQKIYVLALEKRKVRHLENVSIHSLGKERGYNKLRLFLNFNLTLVKILSSKKVDVVFIHMCPEYAVLTWPYARLKNIPIIMWYAHGDVNILLRIASSLVSRVVSSSQDGFRASNKSLAIVGQGIDVEKFSPQAQNEATQSDKKIILSVGRISPVKNYETLIKAADILVNRKNIRDLRFQIVGGVPLGEQKRYLNFLKDIIRKYALEDYVRFVGPISYTQIHNYYQNCDLFVSTSQTGSLDKAILEAMACAKAVVTSNEAFGYLLKNYSDVLLFDKNDINGLVERIIYILRIGAQERDSLVCGLREIVIRNHSLNRFINNIFTVFKDTVGDN